MNVQGIDHVEFYVGDAEASASSFCAGFGFRVSGRAGPETGVGDCRMVLARQGEIQLLFTQGLTAGHPATMYVHRHGDGVANIALAVDDAGQAFEEAVAKGAAPITRPLTYGTGENRVVVSAVGGFGDVTHRFVQACSSSGDFLPGVKTTEAPLDGGEGLLHTVDHVAICLEAGQLSPTARFYQEVFGFNQVYAEYIEVGPQAMNSKVVQSPSQRVTLTLIEPDRMRKPGQIDTFLCKHGGPGVQHLAFSTDDIVGTVRAFEDRGVAFLNTPSAYYDALTERLDETELDVEDLRDANILADRDHWGDLFQIFTRSAHPRGTYFNEIIDRHGARTFGSNNIRALYEAVQRAQGTEPAAS